LGLLRTFQTGVVGIGAGLSVPVFAVLFCGIAFFGQFLVSCLVEKHVLQCFDPIGIMDAGGGPSIDHCGHLVGCHHSSLLLELFHVKEGIDALLDCSTLPYDRSRSVFETVPIFALRD
jgi:membrane associated rhomboid family serine protease